MSAPATEQPRISDSPYELTCPPRWGTARNYDRPTYGPRVAEVATAMGKPFMPHQSLVMDVALEVDPGTGLLVYDTVILTEPRQQGKTCSIVCLMTWRCLAWAKQVVTYAAQTRDHARIKLQDDHYPMIEESVYSDRVDPIWTNGFERLRWDNGSVWGIQATTKKAGHGPTLDMGVADEAWAHEDDRLDTSWTPAMMTRANSQFWIPSTVGENKIKSPWFHGKCEAGREAVEAGVNEGMAFFEWSAPPEADRTDPRTWFGCMPALCPAPPCRCDPAGVWHHTTTERKVRGALTSMAKAIKEFDRGYLNRWEDEAPTPSLIDMAKWEALADKRSRPGSPIAMALDMSIDRQWVSVAIVGLRRDGRMHVEVIAHRGGSAWVVRYLRERAARHRPCGIGIDIGGPIGSLLPALTRGTAAGGGGFKVWRPTMDRNEAAGALLTIPTMRDVAAASGDMYDSIENDAIRWLGSDMQAVLNRAVAGAGTRPLADSWAWARKGNAVISPLVAVTLARWVHATRAHMYDGEDYDVASSVL